MPKDVRSTATRSTGHDFPTDWYAFAILDLPADAVLTRGDLTKETFVIITYSARRP